MQMQHLSKPPHCRVLRPLQSLFLFGITLITPRRESVLPPRKTLIVVLDIQGWDYAVGMCFELGSEHGVVLGS